MKLWMYLLAFWCQNCHQPTYLVLSPYTYLSKHEWCISITAMTQESLVRTISSPAYKSALRSLLCGSFLFELLILLWAALSSRTYCFFTTSLLPSPALEHTPKSAVLSVLAASMKTDWLNILWRAAVCDARSYTTSKSTNAHCLNEQKCRQSNKVLLHLGQLQL